jgi:hypothetical protein
LFKPIFKPFAKVVNFRVIQQIFQCLPQPRVLCAKLRVIGAYPIKLCLKRVADLFPNFEIAVATLRPESLPDRLG